jgi:MoaA/NifB/PqqE/SkfB family radical SAM enzyme
MYPNNFTDLHIELTDKCQASCPMCARNYNGGAERPFVGQNEITLEEFKEWFSPEFLKQVKNFYACGNYGDPIIAKDCLEIFEYVVECNQNIRLSIHTNGSARSVAWWKKLATIMSKANSHDVVFGIDGFAESHVLYRRGTSWEKIIENATAFIESGGIANIDCLVFEHNQHEVELFKEKMLEIGFRNINFKSTARFYDMEQFPVEDTNGNLEYYLKPATEEPFKKISFLKLDQINKDITIWKSLVNESSISPKCLNNKEIYVDALGNVLPCCWVGSDLIELPLEVKLSIQALRNKFVENTKFHFSDFLELNLKRFSIYDILKSPIWNSILDIQVSKPWICSKNCKTC